MLLKTPLNEAHRKLGARMVDFGGWDMPVMYTTPLEEHHAVRTQAGLFDVSHMGEILITGRQAFDLIQKLVTKDISAMAEGQMVLAVMCNEEGGIIDDLTVYKYSPEKYWLVINAGTTPGDVAWVEKHAKIYDVMVQNISDDLTKLDLQGPKAQAILQKLTPTPLSEIKRYFFKEIVVDGVPMTVSRSGYTGEDGFELYFPNAVAEQLWSKLLEVGKADGLRACGLGARDTLRTECGMMLYGHDIDDKRTPFESVYSWVVSDTKDFIGKESLMKQKKEGPKVKLIGFEMKDRGIARPHYPVSINGQVVGEVTSGTPAPSLSKNIGMAYVRADAAVPDSEIEIQIRDQRVKAKIIKMPFYVPYYKR